MSISADFLARTGFPNTQRVKEINRRAEKDREEKRLYMEAQAQCVSLCFRLSSRIVR